MKSFFKCVMPMVLYFVSGVSLASPLDEGIEAFTSGDFIKANSIFESLANAGNASAEYQLGLSYELGRGVDKNDKAAFRWYQAAAQQELPLACLHLGRFYEDGRGVPRDYVKAYKLYAVAGAKASTDANRISAEKKRDYVLKKMQPMERARAR